MRHHIAPAACVLAVLAATACSSKATEQPVYCLDYAAAGLVVTVVDSATGVPAGNGALVVARSATFADTAPKPPMPPNDGPFPMAWEQKGTYTVTVTKPGYRDWTKSGIVVTADQCHVHPVKITARLQK